MQQHPPKEPVEAKAGDAEAGEQKSEGQASS